MRDTGLTAATAPAVRPWYGFLAIAYMLAITWLSSIPRRPAPDPIVVEYGLNLIHVPLFAGLAFLATKSVEGRTGYAVRPSKHITVALALAVFAALDEWHQSFVPGRSASLVDLALDLIGVGSVFLFARLSALASEEP